MVLFIVTYKSFFLSYFLSFFLTFFLSFSYFLSFLLLSFFFHLSFFLSFFLSSINVLLALKSIKLPNLLDYQIQAGINDADNMLRLKRGNFLIIKKSHVTWRYPLIFDVTFMLNIHCHDFSIYITKDKLEKHNWIISVQ